MCPVLYLYHSLQGEEQEDSWVRESLTGQVCFQQWPEKSEWSSLGFLNYFSFWAEMLLSLPSTPLSVCQSLSHPSLKPQLTTPDCEEARKCSLPKFLVGKREGGDVMWTVPRPCLTRPAPAAAVPHPSCNRKVCRCSLGRCVCCVLRLI